jgi:ribosome-associated protein
MEKDEKMIINTIAQTIFDKKGMNILVLDVRKCSSLTDYVVIAEGHVDRHVISIASSVETALKNEGITATHEEGFRSGDWVVLDYMQFIVHLFTPATREKYQLEELWPEAEIVEVNIDLSSSRSVGYVSSRDIVSF